MEINVKKTFIFLLLSLCFLLCSCGGGGKIIFPFEADLEKHYTVLEKMPDGSDVSEYIETSSDNIILENDRFSVGICGENGALWFLDKSEELYYDMTGQSFSDISSSNTALDVYRDNEPFLTYAQGEFYDVVFEKYRPTLTAFYLGENTVRLIYVIGIDQLEFISGYPVVITESAYSQNEALLSDFYKKAASSDFSHSFMSDYCLSEDYYVLKTYPLSDLTNFPTELDSTYARNELLSLGYDPANAKICLFVADVTLENEKIIVDISPERQYRTSAVRTSQYKTAFFDGQVPFVVKTESESEKIPFAGSKFG